MLDRSIGFRGAGVTSVTTYELAKEDLAAVLAARPEISDELARTLAERQAAGELIGNTEIGKGAPPARMAAWFADHLYRLVGVAN